MCVLQVLLFVSSCNPIIDMNAQCSLVLHVLAGRAVGVVVSLFLSRSITARLSQSVRLVWVECNQR
jgi:hypothetical protein